MTIQDEFSSDVYAFLEEKKKVARLTHYLVDFPKFGSTVSKMIVSLTFSSVNMTDSVLTELFELCNTSLQAKTGDRLRFILLGVDKDRHHVLSDSIPDLEKVMMWEPFNPSKSAPQEGFFNHFKLVMKVQKGKR